jgi:N utilization substance protein A
VVPDEQLSLAIGRRGQNVRLASQLSGCDIDILTEAEESERRQEEFRTRSQAFIQALDVDDVIAHLLVTEGFSSVEEVAFVDEPELASIEGFDEDIATELKDRAQGFLEERDRAADDRRRELGVDDDMTYVHGLSSVMLVSLGEAGVKTLDDLADLASDELREIVGEDNLDEETASTIIMASRAHWFEDEDGASAADGDGAADAPGAAPDGAEDRSDSPGSGV